MGGRLFEGALDQGITVPFIPHKHVNNKNRSATESNKKGSKSSDGKP